MGFVFYRPSPRFIEPPVAQKIIQALPASVVKVGVFVNEEASVVRQIAQACGFQMLQFHGDESEEYMRQFSNYRTIKAVRMNGPLDQATLKKFNVSYYLFDAYEKGMPGGTGKVFDWSNLASINQLNMPFFVSGGLSPENVSRLIQEVKPFAVDVSSGVEKSPGIKDPRLIRTFFDAVNFKKS